jgi:deoxyadenosine/deoxycytidine kinase
MRDATINHTWNVYNTLFNHMDMIQYKFNYKDIEKTPWMSEFIITVDASTEKLKEYYSKTGRPVESQYALAAMLDPSQKLSIFELPEWGHP